MRRKKRWQVHPEQPEMVREVSARHGLHRLVARLLVNRGLADEAGILAFLEPTLDRLHSPFGLIDLKPASERLSRAVRQGEPLAIYGDYDVDGLTATAVLHQFFQELGLSCLPYIPDRLTEGYGLNQGALQEISRRCRLLVTVDCGISDEAEVAWAMAQGLEVIVTDHHEVPPTLPPALAVVNPKRAGADYPFAPLAGVGVALLLALGVRAQLREENGFEDRAEPNLKSYLDLVAMGTGADVVPVVGENRILVKEGLKVLEASCRPGIVALKEAVGLEGKPLSFRDVVFRMVPRLNAAGRLGQARAALELLLNTDLNTAREQARHLNLLNRQRQGLEGEVLKEAAAQVRKRGLEKQPVWVLAQEGWHLGVLGIVAARLADAHHRPVALVSLEGGRGRGSARSIPGFHLYQGLHACRDFLIKYGGHQAAAGFSVKAEDLAKLEAGMEAAFEEQVGLAPPGPFLKVDALVELGELDARFFQHLDHLRPFGPGNPEPVFACDRVECLRSRLVGERHLRVTLGQNGCVREAIAFDQGAQHPLKGHLEVAFSPRLAYYQGRMTPELRLLDLRRL